MSTIATNWRVHEQNTLRGFVNLTFSQIGLTLRDCTVHQKNNEKWVGLPGKPQVDDRGMLRRDPITGKILYVTIIEIAGRKEREAFQLEALRAVSMLIDAATASSPDVSAGGLFQPPQPSRKPRQLKAAIRQ